MDLSSRLHKQLPPQLQARLTVIMLPDILGQPATALFTGSTGRCEQLEVDEDTGLTEEQIAHLCIVF